MNVPARGPRSCSALAAYAMAALAVSPAAAQLTLRLSDYATAPMTGLTSASIPWANAGYLARINFMAEEPGGGERFFVNDLNGPLYILGKQTKQFTQYLDFNGLNDDGTPRAGMFAEFVFKSGFSNGLITFQFDPDYRNNGKFYTVHMEDPDSFDEVTNTGLPPKHTVNYASTVNVPPGAGGNNRQTVLVEWTDTNITNNTFEGAARELLRMSMSGQIHPMGDLIFDPNAGPEDPDWRVMYISVGDGGAGEGGGSGRGTPQRLDSLGGKVLRIIPDLGLHIGTSTLSPNGAYRTPNDNPFTGVNNGAVRDEVFALGLRNPHRISWDGPSDTILVHDIGLHTWEEVNIIKSGRNFGYSAIEGNEVLGSNNEATSDPLPSTIPLRITNTTSSGTMTPIYPVVQYGHGVNGQPLPAGDSISSGYVYRGANIPSLYGKYIFGDITTGQLFWSDFDEMLAADDGNPETMAAIHQIDILWDNPNDAPDEGQELYQVRTAGGTFGPMFDIVERAYEGRGGQDTRLPGSADVTGGSNGRADIRIQIDEEGELYILSKSDGMIRYVVEAAGNADFNGDQLVDGADFLIWQRFLGSPGVRPQGDADGDGSVTLGDLDLWKRQFPQTPQGANVPEPTTPTLAGFAFIAAIAAGRTRKDLVGAPASKN